MSLDASPTGLALAPAPVTVLIVRLARTLRHRFERGLAPLALRQRHVVALSTLRADGPSAQRALGQRLSMDASSLVGLLNELEDAGLVSRSRDRADRRRGIIEITSAGVGALDEVDHIVEALERDVLDGLGPEERLVLRNLLTRLSERTAGDAEWMAVDDR